MKTIFLTGHSGFIGLHLVKRLIELGYDVYEAQRNEVPMVNPLNLIEYDYVIHLAATTTLSTDFVPELFENNVVYANKIMQYSSRIIYASSTSASEYTNPYAGTKMYLEYLGEHHPNANGLRFFNVYRNGCKRGIIKRAIDCAKSGEQMDIYGGDQVRDFIYIDDAVNAIIDSLDSKEKIIEIGTGIGRSICGVIETIKELTGASINTNYMPPSLNDMKVSVAEKGINGCIWLEEWLKKMLS